MNHVTPARAELRPWYRQFWPWFLILLPALAVAGCMVTIVLAIRTAEPVLRGDAGDSLQPVLALVRAGPGQPVPRAADSGQEMPGVPRPRDAP